MRAQLEDWKNGGYGLSLGLSIAEIEALIELLREIKLDPDQHFHLSRYDGKDGIGDIEIYVKADDEPDDLRMTSPALPPSSG